MKLTPPAGEPAPAGCTCPTDDEGCLEVFMSPVHKDGTMVFHYFFDPECPIHGGQHAGWDGPEST